MKSKNSPLSRKDEVVIQEVDSEVLIYDLRTNKAFCLNETSAIIWQLCDGNKNVAQITKELSNRLNLPANEDLVWFAIDQLKKEKLIENESQFPSQFAGMSRREVIKKVGLGSMIALPIIASLAAPAAVFAQSCAGSIPDGGGCTADSQCSNCCCVSNTCMMGTRPAGMNCTINCQCASNICSGGTCV